MLDVWVKYSSWREGEARKELKRHDYVCKNVKILMGGGNVYPQSVAKGDRRIGRCDEEVMRMSRVLARVVSAKEANEWSCYVGRYVEDKEAGLCSTMSCLSMKRGELLISGILCNGTMYVMEEQRRMLAKSLNINVDKIRCEKVEITEGWESLYDF